MSNRNKGFILIEVLISYMFWSFMFPVLFSLIVITFKGIHVSDAITLIHNNIIDVFAATSSTTHTYIDNSVKVSFLESRKHALRLITTDWQKRFSKKSCRGINKADLAYSVSLQLGLPPENQITDGEVQGNHLIITTNSATSSDPDFHIYDIQNPYGPITIASLDTGPGLSQVEVVGDTAYVGDTSSVQQVHAIALHGSSPRILWSYKVDGASASTSPIVKSIAYVSGKLIIGTVKTVLPELYIIGVDSSEPLLKGKKEIGASINYLYENDDLLYVLIPLDPEIQVFDMKGTDSNLVGQYDAAGSLGNGKRLEVFNNEIYFGRTIGGKELQVIWNQNGVSSLQLFQEYKIGATVDYIIASKNYVYILAADDQQEFQVWEKEYSSAIPVLKKIYSIDLPERALSMFCSGERLFIFMPHEIQVYE